MKSAAFAIALLSSAVAQPLTRTPIATDLEDPMAIALSPDGDIYITEREGRLLRIRPSTGGVFEVGQIPVEHLKKTDPNSPYAREDGLQGLALDPDFASNHRIYLYYSAPDKLLNRLSRFTISNGQLDMASEKMILEIPTQRDNKVCHHGGGVEFGPDGLLYLSLGDNTNPFESDGFNPVDDREGHDFANAQRSAGNSNDLRGKIVRIKMKDDGGYEIPEGNLFKPGTPNARPEIYVMGCRNPFRFSIDQKNNTLYWGEVGPDAAKDTERGPMGYDEVNQAKKAGFYGWPYFVADNKAYHEYDFATKIIGPPNDQEAPKNHSHINTGLKDLPPAQPAFIWYPYSESKEFPAMGKGGRNAMAGPIYYYDSNRKFNILGKDGDHTLLTYDWMRGKIFKAKLGDEEKLESLTTYEEGFTHPMDLKMAKDGSLWLLEYGTEWWFNTQGRLLHLTPPSNNKPPHIEIERNADKSFKVKSISDPENDPVTITWWLTTGADEIKLGVGNEITSPTTGTEIRAVAEDNKGNTNIARISLIDKKAMPQLILELACHPASLAFGENILYQVKGVTDADSNTVSIRARYIPPTGHDAGGPAFTTDIEKMITSRLCFSCHQVSVPSVGPNYVNVSLKYRDQADAAVYLKGKLKTGSSGAWGEIPMPPQIAVTDDEANIIVDAILQLSEGISEAKGKVGTIKLSSRPESAAPGGAWEITAEAPNHLPFKQRIPASQ